MARLMVDGLVVSVVFDWYYDDGKAGDPTAIFAYVPKSVL